MADSTTNLDLISVSQSAKETTANAAFDAGSPAIGFGRRASTTSGLTWGYYGGKFRVSGLPTSVANGTKTLTPSTTNYLYITSAGVVTLTTSIPASWPGPLGSSAVALYTIVTGTASVTSYTDHRTSCDLGSGGGGSTPTGTGYTHITGGSQDSAAYTATQVTADLNAFVGDDGGSPDSGLKGLVPKPAQGDGATKVLLADGTWGAVAPSHMSQMTAATVLANTTGGTTYPIVTALSVFMAALSAFVGDSGTGGTKGLVPAPSAGDAALVKFLKADGTWATVSVADFIGDIGSPGGGVHGLVPAPGVGEGTTKFLKADGTWAVPSGLGSSAIIVLSPAFNATQTIDLSAYGGYPIVVVTVGAMTSNCTLNLTGGADGQVIRVRMKQGGSGGYTITQGAAIRASTDVPWPSSWSSAVGTIDRLGFEWHGGDSKADLIAVNRGFS